MLTVAILCGGKGSRIASVAGDRPKALVPLDGRPFIDHQLAWLRLSGFASVVLLTGYRGDRIEEHVGSGERFGLDVAYSHDGDVLRGTGGAVAHALGLLSDPFLTVYGDALLPADPQLIARAIQTSDEGVMAVYRNEDRGLASNVRLHGTFVAVYDKQARPGTMTHIDYGINAFRARAFDDVSLSRPVDLAEIHQGMIERGTLRAFEVHERWHEIGSPEGLAEAERFVRTLADFGGLS